VSRGSKAALLVTAALLASTLSACEGGSASGEDRDKDKEGIAAGAAADVSTCKDEAKAAPTPYPSGFPSDWPFPPQSVVFNAEDRGSDGTIVTAVSSAPFEDVRAFMNEDVTAKGFEVEDGETEEHDAEAEWKGNGYHGRWAIRESATCSGETVVQVLSARQ